MKETNMKGAVLLSGGLDSCVIAAEALEKGYELSAITFSYGQRHDKEILSARKIKHALEIEEWKVVELQFLKNLYSESKSTLLTGEVSEHIELGEGEVANSYVPLRNTMFLSIAAGFAETIEADNIFIGANFVDYGGYAMGLPSLNLS